MTLMTFWRPQRVCVRPQLTQGDPRGPQEESEGKQIRGAARAPRGTRKSPRAPPLSTYGPLGTTLEQTCGKFDFLFPESPKSVLYCKLHALLAILRSCRIPGSGARNCSSHPIVTCAGGQDDGNYTNSLKSESAGLYGVPIFLCFPDSFLGVF